MTNNIEKQVGENMVDDMLPPEPKKSQRNAYAHTVGASRRAMEGRIQDDLLSRGYDDDYWNKGDDLSDLTSSNSPSELGAWPKVNKPFKPMVQHPKKPAYFREEYEGPGGWARAKLKRLSDQYPLASMSDKCIVDTLLLESIAATITDEIADLLEETELCSNGEAGKKMRAFLRQHLLDDYLGWDNMVKKYKPLEEEK